AAFYGALLGGEPFHRAVAAGRRQLGLEWAAIQVYARAADGDVYPVVFRPYRGLRPFEERDRRFFFGRAEPTRKVLDRVAKAWSGKRRSRFQLVAGHAASGVSSLVHAGVLPELRNSGWRIVTVRPGSDGASGEKGLARLARALRELCDPAAAPLP